MSDPDGGLGDLRSRAIDDLRAHRWADLLAAAPRLQEDTEYWLTLWGPVCAVAAFHAETGDARAREVDLGAAVPLDGPPGQHVWRVATRTPFGSLRGSVLASTVRD